MSAELLPVGDFSAVDVDDLPVGEGLHGIGLVHDEGHAVARNGKALEVAFLLGQRARCHADVRLALARVGNAAAGAAHLHFNPCARMQRLEASGDFSHQWGHGA